MDYIIMGAATATWLGLGLVIGTIVFWLFKQNHKVLAVAVSFIGFATQIAVGVWGLETLTHDDEHRWRGGSGPDTECYYEVDSEPVPAGKVTIMKDVTYTVCKD